MDGDLHPDGDFSIGEFLVTTFKKYLPAAVRKLGYGFRNQSRQLFSLDLHLTRLGENLASDGVLCENAKARTFAAVAALKNKLIEDGAQNICAFGTAAMRRAANGAADSAFCGRKRAAGFALGVTVFLTGLALLLS